MRIWWWQSSRRLWLGHGVEADPLALRGPDQPQSLGDGQASAWRSQPHTTASPRLSRAIELVTDQYGCLSVDLSPELASQVLAHLAAPVSPNLVGDQPTPSSIRLSATSIPAASPSSCS